MRILYAKDAGNSDVSNIRKKKSVVYSNAEGLGERMQQKIKEMLIKIKDVLVSVWHSYKRMRQENNIYFNILVGLVFFAIVGTGVCMVANAREAAALRQVEIQKEKEALAAIMLEHGIEWEQKGEHKEHLSVLEFKREKRKEEIAEPMSVS